LAEHIEDCDNSHLQTKILHFLAEEGPKAKNPHTYIRFIYNRVKLEKTVIRAAAVSALASFAYKVPGLRRNILILLRKCLTDADDEVRERALLFIKTLEDSGDDSLEQETGLSLHTEDMEEDEREALRDFVFDTEETIDIDALEAYIQQERETLVSSEEPVKIDQSKLLLARPKKQERSAYEEKEEYIPSSQQRHAEQPSQPKVDDAFLNELRKEEQILTYLGDQEHVFSSNPTTITDSGAEYVVQTVKHFFQRHIVVQYCISNTLEDQVLDQVKLNITALES